MKPLRRPEKKRNNRKTLDIVIHLALISKAPVHKLDIVACMDVDKNTEHYSMFRVERH